MTPQQEPPKPPFALVFWILWFGILSGLVIMQMFIGHGLPKGVNQGQPPQIFLIIAAALAFAVLIVRFVVIPRIKTIQQKLPAMIVGLALAEAIGILGLFLIEPKFPATQLYLFVTSIGCIVMLAPVYAMSSQIEGPYQK